jgi:hypothetical protein
MSGATTYGTPMGRTYASRLWGTPMECAYRAGGERKAAERAAGRFRFAPIL